MTAGQLFFISLLMLMIIYLSKKRNILTDRIILLLLIISGVLFVIFPQISSKIANLLGIGRGTDLVLYLFVLLSLFMFIYILSEINKLITKFTEFVRNDAIKNAKDLSNSQLMNSQKEQ